MEIDIKMQPNSKVEHIVFGRLDNDCIVVSNFEFNNTIKNVTTNYGEFEKLKRVPTVVGVWKLVDKKLKKS